jgi:hypothetical protein
MFALTASWTASHPYPQIPSTQLNEKLNLKIKFLENPPDYGDMPLKVVERAQALTRGCKGDLLK